MKEIMVSRRKWQVVVTLLVGVGIVFLSADALLFHKVLPARPLSKGQMCGGGLFAGFGLLLVGLSIRALSAPSLLMRADQDGITLYTGYNNITRPPTPPTITIPWGSVLSTSKGQMIVGSVSRRQGSKTHLVGGSTMQNRTETPRYGAAVKILIDPSVNLDHYSVPFAVVARTATRPEDVTQEDREHFSEEGLKEFMLTECLIAEKVLGTTVDRMIADLNSLMRQCRQ